MEKNIKIFHIILGKGNPNRLNGVNKVAYNLASVQHSLGYTVYVFGITKNPDKDPGYKYSYILELFKAHKAPFTVDKKLLKRLKDLPHNAVVHLHGGFIPEFVTISKWLEKYHIPYIITSHGAYNIVAMHTNRIVKMFYFRWLEKQIIDKAYAIHLIGKSEKEGLNIVAPKKKVYIIPNGQNILKRYPAKTKNTLLVFGYLGRIDIKTKGLDIIINAVKLLDTKLREKIQINIVGGGGEEAKLINTIKTERLTDVFRLCGPKYGEDKLKAISSFDIFLHPSRNEGMPGAVLEAAAQGVPCIVSEETNVGDYIRAYNSGWVLEKNDSAHLSKIISRLAENNNYDDLIAFGENARKMVEKEFSWITVSQRLLNAYGEAIK